VSCASRTLDVSKLQDGFYAYPTYRKEFFTVRYVYTHLRRSSVNFNAFISFHFISCIHVYDSAFLLLHYFANTPLLYLTGFQASDVASPVVHILANLSHLDRAAGHNAKSDRVSENNTGHFQAVLPSLLPLVRTQLSYMFSAIISSQFVPCGGELEYLHRNPASRKRRRKGNPVPNETVIYGYGSFATLTSERCALKYTDPSSHQRGRPT
jgi:hypothetical protein